MKYYTPAAHLNGNIHIVLSCSENLWSRQYGYNTTTAGALGQKYTLWLSSCKVAFLRVETVELHKAIALMNSKEMATFLVMPMTKRADYLAASRELFSGKPCHYSVINLRSI